MFSAVAIYINQRADCLTIRSNIRIDSTSFALDDSCTHTELLQKSQNVLPIKLDKYMNVKQNNWKLDMDVKNAF